MHKLCSLKEIVPGSVVEVPKDFQLSAGEKAILIDLEYASDKTSINSQLLRTNPLGGFSIFALPLMPEDTKLVVDDDVVLQKAAIGAFVAQKVRLPGMAMTCGCDPEIFVEHEDGTVFPAWEFMPTEEEARKTTKEWLGKRWDYKTGNGNTAQLVPTWDSPQENQCPKAVPAYWDGVQAEFAPWAKGCLETLHDSTRIGLKTVLDAARAKDPKAKLTLKSVVELPEVILRDTDDKFIQFRCTPSYNVYNDAGEGVPDARTYKYRCAGGHIHVGYKRTFTAPGIEQIVRGLDGVLGVAGVCLAAGIDNPERRHTYGRAGEFRLPIHGLEYRVLSNFWLSHPAIAMLVFEIARATVRLSESGLFNLCWVAREEETREVINNCDVDGARNIIRRNAGVLMGMLHGIWGRRVVSDIEKVHRTLRENALTAILEGIGTMIDPYDIEKNWRLNTDWKPHCRSKGASWYSLIIP